MTSGTGSSEWRLYVILTFLSPFLIDFFFFNFLSRSPTTAEEAAFAAPGRRRRVRRVFAAVTADGGSVQAVGQRPAVAGGEGGLHHSGVRRAEEPCGLGFKS